MGISWKWFKIWLTATIVFWICISILASAGGFFPGRFQVSYQLRDGLEPWKKGEWQVDDPLKKPLYEIIHSPSQEKLPVKFEWRGYQGPVWNQHVHSRKTETFSYPDGATLDLPTALNDADKEYIKDAFWDQRWSRWWDLLGSFIKTGILLPLGVLAILWVARVLRTTISDAPPQAAKEKPRLPYSPNMERMRKVTLALSAIEILFWLIVAVIGDDKDPLPFFHGLYLLFPNMLFAILAFIMSLLRRGPVTAAVLAILAVYFVIPELSVRILPASWLPSGN